MSYRISEFSVVKSFSYSFLPYIIAIIAIFGRTEQVLHSHYRN